MAQEDDEWAVPVNLSRSGSTLDPQLVIDSAGRHHVLWEDSIEGFVYVSGGPDGWSEPRAVELPFFTRRYFPDLSPQSPTPRFTPTLVADLTGNIHAFWVDTVSDSAGVLKHSSVQAGSFAQIDAWSAPESLETGGIGPAAVANLSGVHLAYVRRLDTAERPAGIYYQRLATGTAAWVGDRLLYSSRYLRGATEETANISLTASDSNRLHVAWDDSARELVFVAESADGESWGAPLEIDRRAAGDLTTAVGPSRITVGDLNGSPIITWRAGHQSGQLCTQYYRTRPANGTTWTLPQIVPGLDGCLTSAQFIEGDDTLLLLGTIQPAGSSGATSAIRTYLMAWDGARWSNPRPQDALTGLLNPDTNQAINLQCLSGAAIQDQLSLVGCDRGVGGDTWWTSRSLGDPADWFPPPAVWEGPVAVAAAAAPVAGVGLVADGAGGTHALWFEQGGDQVFHAFRNETGWSSVRAVLTSDSGPIDTLAVAGDGTHLFLVFRASAGLFYARADAGRPTEWSTPVRVTDGQVEISDVVIHASSSGELILGYTVALNEPRGVYLLRSADQGSTWSAPIQAFSGAAAGWPAVGQPYLAETADGQLHGLWTQRGLPPDNAVLGMGYSRSGDGGATWSPVNQLINIPAPWASLHGNGGTVVHLLWAEPANERVLLWHSLSADSGVSWSEGTQVGSVDGADMPAATLDSTGQLHVVGLEGGSLVSWTFNGAEWDVTDPLVVNLADGGHLAADVDASGRLITTYGLAIPGAGAAEATGGLFAMERPLDLPAAALPTPPPPLVTATPAPTAAPTATPEPTPTIVIPTAPDGGLLAAVPGSGSRTGQLAIAIIPAALVVLIAVIVGVRAIRRGGR